MWAIVMLSWSYRATNDLRVGLGVWMSGTATLQDVIVNGVELASAAYDAVYAGTAAEPPDGLVALGLRWREMVGWCLDGAWPTKLSERDALRFARVVATVVHATLHQRYDRGPKVPIDDLARETARLERAYELDLATLRIAALSGRPTGALDTLWSKLISAADSELAVLCGTVGASAERGTARIGLRVSQLVRHVSMLAAAVAVVHQRFLDSRLRSGLAGIAERRTVLTRRRPDVLVARTTVAGASEGERLELTSVARTAGWIERPQVPYSFVRCNAFELHVHRRNVAAVGIASGRWLWVRGKVESVNGAPVVVAEFEGPGQHSSAVWEDWLATQVRPAYDLAPLVVDMAWELPRIGYRGGSLDLSARESEVIPDA